MNEKKWHENIPENGALTVSDSHDFIVNHIKSIDSFGYALDGFGEQMSINRMRPITADEWWKFAPWKDMGSAPRDEPLILICSGVVQDCIMGISEENQIYSIETGEIFGIVDNNDNWLPLPKECK